MVLCELVLVEFYLLLRNPVVLQEPLTPSDAVQVCERYRSNPRWRLVENAPIMEAVWQRAQRPRFPRRRVIDARLALTVLHHGATEFATANVKDFRDFGFARVWNPAE